MLRCLCYVSSPPPLRLSLQACLDRLQPHLRGLRRVHLLRLLLALAESGHRPREELMARVLGCLQVRWSGTKPSVQP